MSLQCLGHPSQLPAPERGPDTHPQTLCDLGPGWSSTPRQGVGDRPPLPGHLPPSPPETAALLAPLLPLQLGPRRAELGLEPKVLSSSFTPFSGKAAQPQLFNWGVGVPSFSPGRMGRVLVSYFSPLFFAKVNPCSHPYPSQSSACSLPANLHRHPPGKGQGTGQKQRLGLRWLSDRQSWGVPFNPLPSARPPEAYSTSRRETAGPGGWERLLGRVERGEGKKPGKKPEPRNNNSPSQWSASSHPPRYHTACTAGSEHTQMCTPGTHSSPGAQSPLPTRGT